MEVIRASAARRALRWQSASTLSRNWVCRSCRSQPVASLQFARSRTTSAKPYYVTTPIFYVNAAPHVGHMYSMVLADVLKRWQTLTGKPAILCTGTDEHGMKVQRSATVEGMETKEFCDENAAKFEKLAQKANIDYDRFIRTTDPDHVQAVEYFWFLLREKGLIYEHEHAGWYCVSDECFYPESQIEKRMDPFTGEVFMASVETGNKVEWIKEMNYHFRMTALKDKLLDLYETNPNWVVPATRINYLVDWVKNNLEDLSISRPAERLSWGIRVPDDESQTIYVWVDALINYITKTGYPQWTPGLEHEGGWPADVHVIGKDILRFHCVYWPALLLALDLPLPKQILSHAHWTMDRKKMSKSIGNVVNPMFAMDRWGVDTMRFYMIHDGGIADDADYSNTMIQERYKKLLQFGLGNLTSRVAKPGRWSVREAIEWEGARFNRKLAPTANKSLDEAFATQHSVLTEVKGVVAEHMAKLNPSTALQQLMRAVLEINAFLGAATPWYLAKETDNPESKELLQRTIYLAAENLRITGILLQPFMPEKAAQLLDILGVSKEKRTFKDANPYSDFDYGTPLVAPGSGKGGWNSLFPPLLEG
ncbi:tRNA synthetases class I (M)-domain-containing protein [Cercophora newfieldiana]|uniref:Probable methionine--tRNA ligase, mitochondrial n=1 Tax=Cercophora newfieldiana TaxID=92897 RepID=A0AA39YH71_9PEZI|nr:tRNA synthetases class I (M)-domain-containing protein [Cercophora newfieldiana]